ncbi:MAG: DNA-binding domain-containing protein [Rudaea sp.]|nr:DNA-binding domain-containing protein [Rudaea sp.]
MSALASLQHKFQRHVLSGCDGEDIGVSVIATPAADSSERLNVYVHAYRARLIEVLGNDFPGLCALTGAEKFNALCRDYVDATPSTHYNVRWYGERLAGFLSVTRPWSDTPALAEMARFEWALGLSFDAPDEAHVEPADVQSLAPEQWPELRLRLQGAVRRLGLRWNVSAIRRAVDREEAAAPLAELDAEQICVVSRQDTIVRYRLLPTDEAAALDAVENGACFAEICEVLCEWHSEDAVAMRAATLLSQWIQDQWVAELLPAA